jgi:hypothetical protein
MKINIDKALIYLLILTLIVAFVYFLFVSRDSPLHKTFFKDCYEKGGINSNVWCFVNKADSCSAYGWWGGICGDIQSCRRLANKTKIPCYELEERN